ncbi:EEP domain-containing protein, partial [Mesorhizobium sp. M8A.F.Ca.ET.198.01.1.1]
METNDIKGRSLPETVLLTIRGRNARKAKATPRKRVDGAEIVVASYNVHKCIGTDRK